MSAKQKKKLCWNCEGSAPVTEENCPYCGVYLSQITFGGNDSLYPSSKQFSGEKEHDTVPGGFCVSETAENLSISETAINSTLDEKPSSESIQLIVLPLSLLLSGSILALFSISMFLFSHEGIFTLQWSSYYWYFYLFASFILLGAGWWKLQSLD